MSELQDHWSSKQIQILKAILRLNEGFEPYAYTDTQGKRTIGVGFNLDAPGARQKIERLGINFDDLYDGRIPISMEQATILLEEEILIALEGATSIYPNFFSLFSFERQVVVIDMNFNLGRSGYSNFVKHIEAAKRKDWPEAAKQMKDSKWCGQVKDRCPRMSDIMETGVIPKKYLPDGIDNPPPSQKSLLIGKFQTITNDSIFTDGIVVARNETFSIDIQNTTENARIGIVISTRINHPNCPVTLYRSMSARIYSINQNSCKMDDLQGSCQVYVEGPCYSNDTCEPLSLTGPATLEGTAGALLWNGVPFNRISSLRSLRSLDKTSQLPILTESLGIYS